MQQKMMKFSQLKNQKINMRIVLLALAFGFLLSACSKDKSCKNVAPSEEATVLEAFNSSHAIIATNHYTGLYYQIITPGNSAKPTSRSVVYVKYKGTKLDGTVFDSQTNPGATGFNLSSLIEGWQVGLPMIGKGGRILLTVPSGMAYGCLGQASSVPEKNIPPNTPLYFEIDLVDFY
jgi:FKBP-type peptidyl-prolyl cis-trans isomerase FkpA